jgi:hypothetical protein
VSTHAFAQKISHNDVDAKKGSDLNDDRTPREIAKEMGKQSKKQKKAYLKQLKKTKREMDKRNRKKQKNIVLKTKTRKVRGSKSKNADTNSGATPKEILSK